MVYLTSITDISFKEEFIDFCNSLDKNDNYLLFFYTFKNSFCEDFKSRGPTIISKGFYLDTLFLHINYEHASLLNFVSQLKENFSRKRSYFEEFGCFDYGEEN